MTPTPLAALVLLLLEILWRNRTEMLKLSKKAVRSYLKTGRLKGRKTGKRWLVHEDAVREFLNTESIATES